MSSREQTPSGIGSALKDARMRLGMDVKEAEERTKIRARYLRALEAEDWEALPAPAYVRGFLRTYGALLELDGEMLADEFRRMHERGSLVGASPAPEPILGERRRPPGSRPPSRTPLIIGIAAGIIILLVILGTLGGDDDSGSDGDAGKPAKKLRKANKGEEPQKLKAIDLSLTVEDDVRVCLVGDGKSALLDAQMIAAGTSEDFSGYKRYRLDLQGGGAVELKAGGDSEQLDADDDATYEADSEGVREVSYAGPECP
jgi:helix-turn-helix protein